MINYCMKNILKKKEKKSVIWTHLLFYSCSFSLLKTIHDAHCAYFVCVYMYVCLRTCTQPSMYNCKNLHFNIFIQILGPQNLVV